MNIKQSPKAVRITLCIGILVFSLTMIAAQIFKLSDSLKGFLMGMGIGIELFALIKLKRAQHRLK